MLTIQFTSHHPLSPLPSSSTVPSSSAPPHPRHPPLSPSSRRKGGCRPPCGCRGGGEESERDRIRRGLGGSSPSLWVDRLVEGWRGGKIVNGSERDKEVEAREKGVGEVWEKYGAEGERVKIKRKRNRVCEREREKKTEGGRECESERVGRIGRSDTWRK